MCRKQSSFQIMTKIFPTNILILSQDKIVEIWCRHYTDLFNCFQNEIRECWQRQFHWEKPYQEVWNSIWKLYGQLCGVDLLVQRMKECYCRIHSRLCVFLWSMVSMVPLLNMIFEVFVPVCKGKTSKKKFLFEQLVFLMLK